MQLLAGAEQSLAAPARCASNHHCQNSDSGTPSDLLLDCVGHFLQIQIDENHLPRNVNDCDPSPQQR
jgi:hypothetical protein